MSKLRSSISVVVFGWGIVTVAGAGCSSSSSQGSGGAGGGKGGSGSGGLAGHVGGGGHAGAAGGATGATGGSPGSAGGAAGGAAGTTGGAGGAAAGGAGGAGAGGQGGAGGFGALGGGAVASGGAGGHGGTGGAAGAGGTTVVQCGPGTFGGGETTTTISSITAAVVDETGAPVVGQPAMACGIDLCTVPYKTDASGDITFGTQLAPKKAALRLGDGLSFTSISIPLTMPTTDLTAGGKKLILGKLSNKAGAALVPGTSATSGNVTLTLAASTTVGIDTLTYATAADQMFRSVAVPAQGLAPWLDTVKLGGAPAAFSLFYGVAPLQTTFCPPAKVTVDLPHATATPNDLLWPPGTPVEFWITTSDPGQAYAPYAGWRKMSDGVVSSDGTSASTLPGQGFTTLENFAIRKTP